MASFFATDFLEVFEEVFRDLALDEIATEHSWRAVGHFLDVSKGLFPNFEKIGSRPSICRVPF